VGSPGGQVRREQVGMGSRRRVQSRRIHKDPPGQGHAGSVECFSDEPGLIHRAEPVGDDDDGNGLQGDQQVAVVEPGSQGAQEPASTFHNDPVELAGDLLHVAGDGGHVEVHTCLACGCGGSERWPEPPWVDLVERQHSICSSPQEPGISPSAGGQGFESDDTPALTVQVPNPHRCENGLACTRVVACDKDDHALLKSWASSRVPLRVLFGRGYGGPVRSEVAWQVSVRASLSGERRCTGPVQRWGHGDSVRVVLVSGAAGGERFGVWHQRQGPMRRKEATASGDAMRAECRPVPAMDARVTWLLHAVPVEDRLRAGGSSRRGVIRVRAGAIAQRPASTSRASSGTRDHPFGSDPGGFDRPPRRARFGQRCPGRGSHALPCPDAALSRSARRGSVSRVLLVGGSSCSGR